MVWTPLYYLSNQWEVRFKPPEHSREDKPETIIDTIGELEVKRGNKSIKIMAIGNGIPVDSIWSVKGKALITN